MERVLLADLRMLAELLGPHCMAAEALSAAGELTAPEVYRCGRRLIVTEAAIEDTIVIRRVW